MEKRIPPPNRPPEPLTRRDFLVTSAQAVVAAAALGPALAAVPGCGREGTRVLGRTGLRVSALSLGGGGIETDVYKAGLDDGINFIHSSLSYGTLHRAASAIAGRREHVLVGIKFDKMSQAYLDASLERLETDYVDILFFPLVTPKDARDRSHLELFERFRKQKKARFLGITTHSGIAPTLNAAISAGFWDVLMPSYVPDQRARAALRPVLERAHEQDMGIVAMKTMAGIQPTALGQMQTALKQVLADPAVSSVVKGMLTFESLKALKQAAGMEPTARESASLQQHLAARRGEVCFLCGACPPCPRGVNVFEVMRDFDYYYTQAARPDIARTMYSQIPPAERGSACDNCGRCAFKCPYGVNIAAHVRAADLVLG
jgi:predicted aldo/keto reductase-like oxidoreductase